MDYAEFWKEFFELYKDLPALWCAKDSEYNDLKTRSNCYLKLTEKLIEVYPDADREMVVNKINKCRTSYRKELRKLKQSKEAGKVYKPKLWCFDYLSFLNEQEEDNKIPIHEDVKVQKQKEASQAVTTTNTATIKKVSSQLQQELSKGRKINYNYHKKQPSRKFSSKPTQEDKEDAEILAKSWATEYTELQERQKIIASKLITNILHYGGLGSLNMDHIRNIEGLLQKESINSQHQNSQPQSAVDGSFRCDGQEYSVFIEYCSSSASMSPPMNSISEIKISDLNFEDP